MSPIFFTILYFITAYVSVVAFRIRDFSSFWPPNGVYVGAYLASRSTLTRRLLIPFLFVANWIVSKITQPSWSHGVCVAFSATNLVESLGVSFGTCIGIALLERRSRSGRRSGLANGRGGSYQDHDAAVDLDRLVRDNCLPVGKGGEAHVEMAAQTAPISRSVEGKRGDDHIEMDASGATRMNGNGFPFPHAPVRSLSSPFLKTDDIVWTPIVLENGCHLLAFGLACMWCFFSALIGAYTSSLISKNDMSSRYIKWLGRNVAGIG